MVEKINQKLSKLADRAREIAFKEFKIPLDYSLNSLVKLEKIIELESNKITEKENNDIENSSRIWGIFLGEIIRQKYSGDWTVKNNRVVLSLLGNNISPIQFIKNRFLGTTKLSVSEYHDEIQRRLNMNKPKHYGKQGGKEVQESIFHSNSNLARNIYLVGSILLIIGALLPWAKMTTTFGTMSLAGYEGDGMISGGIGVLLLIGGLLSKGKLNKPYSIAGAIFGGISGLVVIPKIFSIGSITSEIAYASVGAGIYVSVLGVILVIVGGIKKVE